MSWTALFSILIRFLPVIADLLQELFAKSSPPGSPDGRASRAAVAEAFAAARGQTWVWHLGRRAKLRAAERIATRRADELFAALRYGAPVPVLTAAERTEIERA